MRIGYFQIHWRRRPGKAGFIAGQLNSTRRRVELRRGSVHSDADATGRRVVS